MLIRLLLALDSRATSRRLRSLFKGRGVVASDLEPGEPLVERLSREDCDLVIADRAHIADPPAETVGAIRKLPERPEVIVVLSEENAADRARLIAAGCLGVVFAGLPAPALRAALLALVARRREDALGRLGALRPGEICRLSDFAASSLPMQRLVSTARRLVSADSSLLVLGETGVGKEWLARAIHAEGPHAGGPFIAVNCAAFPESLLESELFGHERGAFTGAVRARRGYFELAHRGTLFLDEIGEMPAHLQVKLLRVLQERKIQRVGSEQALEVEVRVVAATNRDLKADMATGRFRQDLFFRLGVVSLTVPPLRERREDIADLVNSYFDQFRARFGRPVGRITDRAMESLTHYSWPGNVRELINVLERAVLLCTGSEIDLADLPELAGAQSGSEAARSLPASPPGLAEKFPATLLEMPMRRAREDLLDSFERAYLSGVLRASGGRIGEAAARAGIHPRSLFDKMRHHGMRKEDFKMTRPSPGPP